MSTLAFRGFGEPAPRRAPPAKPSSSPRPFHGIARVLAYIAALVAMVTLVVVVRVGVYALGHSDQPFFRMLIERLIS